MLRFAIACLIFLALPVLAQFRVEVTGVGMTQMPIVVAPFKGEAASPQKPAAIVQADLRLLSQAPGVGKRTAERLAVELRTRLQERYASALDPIDRSDLALEGSSDQAELPADVRQEVSLTLTALGYEALEINRALRAVAGLPGLEDGQADDWLRESLRWLSRSQAA